MSQRAAVTQRGRLLGLFKLAFAAALLAWVGLSLPWRDSLLHLEAGEELEVKGKILGDWQGDAVSFRPDPEAVPDERWPAELRRALETGEALTVQRAAHRTEGEPSAPGYDWRPSMPRVFLELDPRYLVAALAALVVGVFFGVLRWWRILHLAACPSSFFNTMRLVWLGMFFNLVVPGLTGGDLVKALLVVREHPERRADALVSVVIDRMIGLWTLIGLAAGLIWLTGGPFTTLRYPVGLTFIAATGFVAIVLMSRVRRMLRIDALLARLPQARRLKELDRAATVFRGRPGMLGLAVLLSLGNHMFVIGAIFAIGRAFGDTLGFGAYVGIVPIANVLSSLPLTPGGWGVGEQAFGTLFELVGSIFALGVAVSVTYRLCNMGLGLIGGAFMLLPGGRKMRKEVRATEADLGAPAPTAPPLERGGAIDPPRTQSSQGTHA